MIRKIALSRDNYIRHELIYEFIFVRGLQLTLMELRLLVLLVIAGEVDFGLFCRSSVEKLFPTDLYGHKSQNIRNVVNKMVKRGFISKTKINGKMVVSILFDIAVEIGSINEIKIKVI